ncbi:MAG: hypothetical protein KGY99_10640 [Phycisphaerae bacterium]|nr:hypothetical protein [Phycisphaerae bacterium]
MPAGFHRAGCCCGCPLSFEEGEEVDVSFRNIVDCECFAYEGEDYKFEDLDAEFNGNTFAVPYDAAMSDNDTAWYRGTITGTEPPILKIYTSSDASCTNLDRTVDLTDIDIDVLVDKATCQVNSVTMYLSESGEPKTYKSFEATTDADLGTWMSNEISDCTAVLAGTDSGDAKVEKHT